MTSPALWTKIASGRVSARLRKRPMLPLQHSRQRAFFGSWNTKPVQLPEMLHTPLFLPNFPQSPLLKVPRKCGRISLTTYLTTTAKSLTEYPGLAKFGIAPGLGPGDRGFKSRSPDQNRQFSVRKLAVLSFQYQQVNKKRNSICRISLNMI